MGHYFFDKRYGREIVENAIDELEKYVFFLSIQMAFFASVWNARTSVRKRLNYHPH